MLRLFLLAVIGVWGIPGSLAQPDEPISSDADAMLEQCLAGADVDTCAGIWVSQCSETAFTTVEILGCYQPEIEFWETYLSKALLELEQLYLEQDQFEDASRALAPRLSVYQKDWEAWRAAKCGFEYDKFRGGSLGRITHIDCQLTETAKRVEELQSMLEEAGL